MSKLIIVALVVIALYLARQWRASEIENNELRNQAESLRRRMARLQR
jgi:sensor domain CHASE-containing protein